MEPREIAISSETYEILMCNSRYFADTCYYRRGVDEVIYAIEKAFEFTRAIMRDHNIHPGIHRSSNDANRAVAMIDEIRELEQKEDKRSISMTIYLSKREEDSASALEYYGVELSLAIAVGARLLNTAINRINNELSTPVEQQPPTNTNHD